MATERDGSLRSDGGRGELHVRRRAKISRDRKRKGRDRTGGMKIVGGRGTAIPGKRSSLCSDEDKLCHVVDVSERDEQAGRDR